MYVVPEEGNLNDDVTFSNGCSLGRCDELTSGSSVSVNNDEYKELKKYARVGGRGSKKNKPTPPANIQESASMPMEWDEGMRENRDMEGWRMGSQIAIIPENWSVGILKFLIEVKKFLNLKNEWLSGYIAGL